MRNPNALIKIPVDKTGRFYECIYPSKFRYVKRGLWFLMEKAIVSTHFDRLEGRRDSEKIIILNGSDRHGGPPPGNPTHRLGNCLDWLYPGYPAIDWERWLRLVTTFKILRDGYFPATDFKKIINTEYKIALRKKHKHMIERWSRGHNRLVDTPDDNKPGDGEHREHTHTTISGNIKEK